MRGNTGRERHKGGFAPVLLLAAAVVAFPSPRSEGPEYTSRELADSLSRFQAVNPRFAKGRALFARGDVTAAKAEFEACAKALPGHAFALFYLANIRYLGKDYAGALEAVADAEGRLAFMEALGAYARAKNIRAIDDARRALESENETNMSCRASRRLEEMVRVVEDGRINAEERAAGEAEARGRRAALYAYFHGNVLFQLRRYDEAFAQYGKALAADPRNGDACNNAAAILLMAGRAKEAEDFLERAVAAGVEDRINLKLKKLVAEALGKPTAGILEEEFDPREPDGIRAARFSVNAGQGKPNAAPLFVNTYVVYDGASRDAVIIDPGAADPRLEAFIADHGLVPRLILNTHGHEDHRGGNARWARLYGIGVAVSAADAVYYEKTEEPPASFLRAGTDPLAAGTLSIRVFETPGHTPGSLCFLAGGFLFTGDSLFEDTIGRVAAADEPERLRIQKAMIARLREVLAPLPGDTRLLPGHGRAATLAAARQANGFLIN